MRSENAYTELLSGSDYVMMPWLRKFQVSLVVAVSNSRLAAELTMLVRICVLNVRAYAPVMQNNCSVVLALCSIEGVAEFGED